MIAPVLAILLQAASPQPASPESAMPGFTTGEQLLAACDNASERRACNAYIMGAVDSFEYARAGQLALPRKTTSAETTDIVVAWLRSHPEMRRRHYAGGLVITALREAFPK